MSDVAYTYAALQHDLHELELEIAEIKRDAPQWCWLEAFAAVAEQVEHKAQLAGLGHDASVGFNAILIRTDLLDPSGRVT